MGVITDRLTSAAVYWAPSTPDDFGRPTWGTPSEINVRWETHTEELRDAQGEVRVSRARVFTDTDVVEDGVLLLSDLDSNVTQVDPFANEGAYEILKFKKINSLISSEILRVAYL